MVIETQIDFQLSLAFLFLIIRHLNADQEGIKAGKRSVCAESRGKA